jgi:FHS family L-fucose permease-like MFS transporter
MLAQYLNEQHRLTALILDSVRGTNEVFNIILNDGLKNNTSVKRLSLINFEHLDVTTISHLIEHNKSIEYLCLRHDKLFSNDAILIANALKVNMKLKSIDLSHNYIGKNGALILANIFQEHHSSLISINLIDNDIDDESQELILSQCQHSIRIILSCENEPILSSGQTFIDQRLAEKKLQFHSIIYVTFVFFLWGVPHQLNDVLIRQFMKLFVLSRFEAGLVQSTFFMGYFVLALPAAFVLRRWGYKMGIILGFVLYGIGAFLFWPAALTGQYPPFLLALFVIATGLAFLETAANPYIANAAGPMETSEKRLNIAQAFNPLGMLTGALLGPFFIFSDIHFNENEIAQMREKRTYDDYLKQETLRVVQPYAILGGIAFLWAMLIAPVSLSTYTKINQIKSKQILNNDHQLYRSIFLLSIIAQFAYVGAQVGTWSYFMQYIHDYVQVQEQMRNYLYIGTIILFTIGRFIAALFMYIGCSPSILLATCAFCNFILITITVVLPNSIGVAALFFTSFFMAPMFPTIFALGIKDMDESTTKLASSFLIMACIGGAVSPALMNLITVETKRLSLAFVLPGGEYLIVGIFALLAYKLRNRKAMNK